MWPWPGAEKTPVAKVIFVTKVSDVGRGVGYDNKLREPTSCPETLRGGGEADRAGCGFHLGNRG